MQMHEIITRMMAIDSNGLATVLMICGLGCMIMRSVLPIAGLAIASYPLLVVSSLFAHALIQNTDLAATLEKGSTLALSSGIGMTVALVVIVALVRIAMLVHDFTGRRPQLLEQSQDRAPETP
jgi:hypothetical protein